MILLDKKTFGKIEALLGREQLTQFELLSIPKIGRDLFLGEEEIRVYYGGWTNQKDYLHAWENCGLIEIVERKRISLMVRVASSGLKEKLLDIWGTCEWQEPQWIGQGATSAFKEPKELRLR